MNRRELLNLIYHDFPFASVERLNEDSRVIVASLVDDGYLEYTESVAPDELREILEGYGVSIIQHHYQVTPRGIMYMQGAIGDTPETN